MSFMIRVFFEEKKGNISMIAVADHQRDLNNLRLMSYTLFQGKDKVQLIKEEYGGPYLKFKCDEFMDGQGKYDMKKIAERIKELEQQYN